MPIRLLGGVSERFKELVLKTSDPKGPWVRIPPPPPLDARRDGREVEGGRLLSD